MEEELEVIHKGLANAKNGFKAVPGKLYLTATYIVHKPNDYFDEEINIPLNRVAKNSGCPHQNPWERITLQHFRNRHDIRSKVPIRCKQTEKSGWKQFLKY